MEAWEIEARAAIGALLPRLQSYGDAGRLEDLADLFAPGGVYVLPSGQSATGPSAIRAMLDGVAEQASFGRDAGSDGPPPPKFLRHNATTSRVEFSSAEEATGDTYYLVTTDSSVDHWGRWQDVFARQPDGAWLFLRRTVVVEGSAEGSWMRRSGL